MTSAPVFKCSQDERSCEPPSVNQTRAWPWYGPHSDRSSRAAADKDTFQSFSMKTRQSRDATRYNFIQFKARPLVGRRPRLIRRPGWGRFIRDGN